VGGALVALLGPPAGARGVCAAPQASPSYTARVATAVASRRDLWGEQLLRVRGGPTFRGASGHLAPLLYARSAGGRPLTRTGVYYLPFAAPDGPLGAGAVALHVADGSEIVSERVGGPSLTVSVGGSPYGSCLSRLTPARLSGGWLPILETRYAGYAQESFAARVPETGSLVSFVRVSGPGTITLTPSVSGLHRAGNRLVRGSRTYLVLGKGGHWNGRSVAFRGTAYAAWLDRAAPVRPFVLDRRRYVQARSSVGAYWRGRLEQGAAFDVPESRVMDAQRALLVQNLVLSWRYSIGNAYEEASFPESLDQAQVMAELGYPAVADAIVRVALNRGETPYPSWTMGEELLAAAVCFRLSGDDRFLAGITPKLSRYVAALARSQSPGGLLAPEHFSSDVKDDVRGLHAQSIAWEGLDAIAGAWRAAGRASLAARADHLAARLGPALRRAALRSERRLTDGSLFVPMRLDARERPYETVTESRQGSYWNLVAPYAFASGLFTPGGAQARGALRYLLEHGSRLLGLVRAGAYSLYGHDATPSESGTDQVYGVNTSRFLAAEDQADQLVLSLYGQLAAGMTPGTFVAGEAASVAPLDGLRYRAMYLPPNATANDAFLETLRQTLVQDPASGLRLAFATPRGWLAAGKRIEISGAPTRFGPVSYSLAASAHSVRVHLDAPSARILLRLRLPPGRRIVSVAPQRPFDAGTGTIDLSGVTSPVDFLVRTT